MTHLLLLLTSLLVTVLAAPTLLGVLGLMDGGNVAGWSMLLSLWLALPTAAVALLAVFLSFLGVVKGPASHRLRLAVWWACFATAVFAFALPRPELNPYTGSSGPSFGLGDALLAISLMLCFCLPCVYLLRPVREHVWR